MNLFKCFQIVSFICITYLCACTSSTSQKSGVDSTRKSDITIVKTLNYLKILGDSVEIPPFKIKVVLSDSAKKELLDINETVHVLAMFEGELKGHVPSIYRKKVEMGQLALGNFTVELKGEGIAEFKNLKFPKKYYDALTNKDINLLINIVSGRRSNPDNLLSGDILYDKMSKIKGQTYTLKERLISED